jgi:acetyl esterase/lipase
VTYPLATTPGPLSEGTAAFTAAEPIVLASGEVRIDNIIYSCDAGYRPLMLDLRLPAAAAGGKPVPLVIMVHGGGWVFGSRRRQAPNLHAHNVVGRIVDAGYALAIIDYRLAREAKFPAQILDVRAAVRWLRVHAAGFNIDPTRFALWGESAGAHLVTMAAFATKDPEATTGESHDVSDDVQAIVEWYGPANMADLLPAEASATVAAGSQETVYGSEHPVVVAVTNSRWSAEEMSPLTYVRADLPPIFIAHGRDDVQVPVEQSHKLVAALQQAGANVTYKETDGDHVFVGSTEFDAVIDDSIAFLATALNNG